MFANRHSEPFTLSSECPYSCSLVAFALRLGGTIDPAFLIQCQILDPKLQKAIDQLKPIPLTYESSPSTLYDQEDLYLDMDVPAATPFIDPWQFEEYNAWTNSPDQWNSSYALTDDLVIDFI